jgi:hypothetical protein
MKASILFAAIVAGLAVSALAVGHDAPRASACMPVGPHRPYVIQPNGDCSNILVYYLNDAALTGDLTPALQEEAPEGEHKDVPWVPILILSIAIPAAFLIVPSFLMAKRGSGGPAG